MSTVVVVRKGDSVAIAGDTLTTSASLKMLSKYEKANDKICRVNHSYIGFVGSAVTKLVFESLFKHEKEKGKLKFDGQVSIFEAFRKIHPILKEKYFLNPKDEEDDPYESSQLDALIANKYGIFGVYSLREVFEYKRFWAIGSGQDFALGAMYAVYDQLDSAEEIARIGVTAGCEFDKNSSVPYTIYSLKLKHGTGESNGHEKA